ncbi:ABC transporter substrate-binding protein [Nocardioides sp.]|uniref:ABC transporter substrate-binding protein n=1 Tax=Nocardioides sp. TaxID=35761 RepID=UPI003D0DE3D1
MNRPIKLIAVASTLAVTSVLLAACGDSGDSSGSDTANAPKGDPIVIGYLIPDSGPEANPQVAPGLKAGLDYINGEMGGINGRPLEVIECHTDSSPAKETSCANDFVEKKVVAVLDGFDRGTEYSLPVYKSAKIPVIGNVAQNAVADTDTSGTYWALGPANAVYAIGPLVAFKEAGMTNISYGLNDVPAQHTYADKFLVPVAKELGLEFNAIYYDDATPNFSVVAATAESNGSDLLGVVKLVNPAQCKQFIDQSRQAGFEGDLLAGNCVGIEQLGSDSEGVYAYSNNYFPAMRDHAPEAVQEDLDTMEKVMSDIPEDERGFFTYQDFATLMDFTRIVEPLDTIDAASVTEALKGLKDYQAFAGTTLTCDGTQFPGTSACSNRLLLSESLGDGTLKPTGSDELGGFVEVDPGLVPGS